MLLCRSHTRQVPSIIVTRASTVSCSWPLQTLGRPYKFLYVDVGAEGGASDGGTWKNCTLHDAVEENRAGLIGLENAGMALW